MAKNPYNHVELRRQQQKADEGLLSSSGDSRSPLRASAVPLAILLVGVIMAVVNVLPGLGIFLIIGGTLGLVVTVTMALLGR